MNNTPLQDFDFVQLLPQVLQDDPDVLAFAQMWSQRMQKLMAATRLVLIYARIDELDEMLLDILAYDLHVDWYDYGYSIETKRRVIKDSVKVHMYLGTVYAVKTALGNVYPHSEVEEWFTYNGRPHFFRVVLDVTNTVEPAEYFTIRRTVNTYKRLASHMEELIYQTGTTIRIGIGTEYYIFRYPMTGQGKTGCHPRRNTLAGFSERAITLWIQSGAQGFVSDPTGTKPVRSTLAGIGDSAIVARSGADGQAYSMDITGRQNAGERPHRSVTGHFEDITITTPANAAGVAYIVPATGMVPERSTSYSSSDSSVGVSASGEGDVYSVPAAGTAPERATQAAQNQHGIVQQVSMRHYRHRVKRCGEPRGLGK